MKYQCDSLAIRNRRIKENIWNPLHNNGKDKIMMNMSKGNIVLIKGNENT